MQIEYTKATTTKGLKRPALLINNPKPNTAGRGNARQEAASRIHELFKKNAGKYVRITDLNDYLGTNIRFGSKKTTKRWPGCRVENLRFQKFTGGKKPNSGYYKCFLLNEHLVKCIENIGIDMGAKGAVLSNGHDTSAEAEPVKAVEPKPDTKSEAKKSGEGMRLLREVHTKSIDHELNIGSAINAINSISLRVGAVAKEVELLRKLEADTELSLKNDLGDLLEDVRIIKTRQEFGEGLTPNTVTLEADDKPAKAFVSGALLGLVVGSVVAGIPFLLYLLGQ